MEKLTNQQIVELLTGREKSKVEALRELVNRINSFEHFCDQEFYLGLLSKELDNLT